GDRQYGGAARALLLEGCAAPVEGEVRRQQLLRDGLDPLDRLAGADPGHALAEDLHRRQVVEAVERVRSRRVLDPGERRQWDRLAGARPDVHGADVVGAVAV